MEVLEMKRTITKIKHPVDELHNKLENREEKNHRI